MEATRYLVLAGRFRYHHAAPRPAATRSQGLVGGGPRGGEVRREGGCAAGFRDAHPFPMPGQVCVAVDRAQGLAVLGQEERFQQKGQHRRGHVVGILIRLGEMTDARQLSRAEARQVPLTEGTTRISGRYSSSPLRRKASRVTDPPMVQSPLCLITSR